MTTTPVHSITDEQIAEIVDFADESAAADWEEVIGIKAGVLRRLITRLREAEKDAARYRWIRESTASIAIDGDVLELKLDEAVDISMQAAK